MSSDSAGKISITRHERGKYHAGMLDHYERIAVRQSAQNRALIDNHTDREMEIILRYKSGSPRP